MTVERQTFDVAGTVCSGHLYLPAGSSPRPCVVMCPGFGGTQDTPALIAAAEAFAEAGYIAMTFDYRGFGLSGGEPRQLVDIPAQLDDIRAAIQHVRGQPRAAADQIVLWGSSLGGGHAITVAAQDARIAAVLTQVPFNGFPKAGQGPPRSTRSTVGLLSAILLDRARGALGLSPHYIPAVGEENAVAVMASAGASQTVAAMHSPTWQNRIAPRGVLQMMRYKPGDHVRQLRAPLLVCIAEQDQETVGELTTALAHDAPHGELIGYPCTHFEIYHPHIRAQVISDQLRFLSRTLAG